jgi:hypothetical protein
MSKAQRLRQQKGMERAEAVLDQLEIKKAKSFNRAKTIKERSVCDHLPMNCASNRGIEHILTNLLFLQADWTEMNKKTTAFAALQQNEDEEEEDGDEDVNDDAMATEQLEPSHPMMASIFAPNPTKVVSNSSAADSAPADEYDEIT